MRLAREFRRPDWRQMLAEMSATELGEWAEHFGKNSFSDMLLDAEFATLKSLISGLVTGTHHDAEMFSLITDPESLHEKTDDELMILGEGISGMYMTGASMVLGGVAQMLAPKPKMSEMRQTDNGRQNTYFSSLDNMVANGNTLPVLYGEMQVGSRVISQEVSTADEGDGGQVVVIGR